MPLRVTVELVPGGDTSKTERIGHLYIINVGAPAGYEGTDLRRYEVGDCDTRQSWFVEHRRSAGALALVDRAVADWPRAHSGRDGSSAEPE